VRPHEATELSRRRILAVGALLLTSAFGVTMVAFRMSYSGTGEYRNLLWNLVLAWVPFVIALVVYDRHRRGVSPRRLAAPALVWLLFLPNAPYLVTEYKFLAHVDGAPLWYDMTLLTTFAWVGLLLGFASLFLMHTVAERVFGAAASWCAALVVLALTGFGIYLGRFERWNSWDVVLDPVKIASGLGSGLADPLSHARTLAITIAMGVFLSLGYLVLYSFLRLAAAEADERR
jgi:uncharacterized membrane protein